MKVVKKSVSVFVLLFIFCLFFFSESVQQVSVESPSNNHTSGIIKNLSILPDNEMLTISNDYTLNQNSFVIGLTNSDLPGAESLVFNSEDTTELYHQKHGAGNKLFRLSSLNSITYSGPNDILDSEPAGNEGQMAESLGNNAYKSKKITIVKGADAERLYFPIIKRVSDQYDLDPLLVKAIIVAESGFDPLAVSKVGARGLMQLMPPTAKAMGVQDSFNPEHNIAGGVKYFKKMLDRFDGDVRLALAAYNAGSRKVREYRGIPPYAATRYYIRKVCKLHEIYIRQQRYSLENV